MLYTPSKHPNEHGFSLIEAALVIMIIGLMIAPLLELYRLYLYNKQMDGTLMAIERTDLTLKRYFEVYGHYPCPAVAETAPNPPTGLEDCTAATAAGNVRIGAVPYATLGMKLEEQTDGFGYALHYIVSNDMTNRDAAGKGDYTINRQVKVELYDVDAGPPGTALTDAVYALISPGRSGKGGVHSNGVANPTGCDATDGDGENCDGDDTIYVTNQQISGTIAAGGNPTLAVNAGANQYPSVKLSINTLGVNAQRNNILRITPPSTDTGNGGQAIIRKITRNEADELFLDEPLAAVPAANSQFTIIPNVNRSRYTGEKLKIVRNTRHKNTPSTAPGNPGIYDDYVFFRTTVSDAPWMAGNGGSVAGLAAGPNDEIWIGYSETTPPEQAYNTGAVEVNGEIKATQVKSDEICLTNDQTKCFNPAAIGDTANGMKCPNPAHNDPADYTLMVGIANGEAWCGRPEVVDNKVCAPGLALAGNDCVRPDAIIPAGKCGGIKVADNCGGPVTTTDIPMSATGVSKVAGPLTLQCQATGAWQVTAGNMAACAGCNYHYEEGNDPQKTVSMDCN